MTLYMRLIRRANVHQYINLVARNIRTAYGLEHVICEGGAPVGCGYRGQREDLKVGWAKSTDHVS